DAQRNPPQHNSMNIRTTLILAICPLLSASAFAQPYPNKPIRIINSTAAGGPAELIARMLGDKLTAAWGQQVVVDSRGGAGGIIGAEMAARAAPDGYTLLLGS